MIEKKIELLEMAFDYFIELIERNNLKIHPEQRVNLTPFFQIQRELKSLQE